MLQCVLLYKRYMYMHEALILLISKQNT